MGRTRSGGVVPPTGEAKRERLLQLFQAYGHTTLIESGTYLGDTVAYFLPYAERIISVEIDPHLCQAADRRFRNHETVEILHGDAADEVPRLLRSETEASCLVWLDGHYSTGLTGRGSRTEPAQYVLDSLAGSAAQRALTIVVDDLRMFGRDPEFPKLETLVSSARRAFPTAQLWAELDGLVIHYDPSFEEDI